MASVAHDRAGVLSAASPAVSGDTVVVPYSSGELFALRAENGRVALARIAERLPCFLVLDLEMPVMSGWEVLAALRRLRGD